MLEYSVDLESGGLTPGEEDAVWMMTTFGFFSVVQKPGEKDLTIRSRARSDLEALKEEHLPSMGEIIKGGTDYQFRAHATHDAVAEALGKIAQDIDYSNFKDTVEERQGADRAHVYFEVWSTLHSIKKATKKTDSELAKQKGKKLSYGGVVFDGQGRVLLRKVAGGFGGSDWTYAKGRLHKGEKPEETALREVQEENGTPAKIIAEIPGLFEGTDSMTGYFVMEVTGELGPHDKETEKVEWLTPEDAKTRLRECGSTSVVKERDLEVLEAALKVRDAPGTSGNEQYQKLLKKHKITLANRSESSEFVFDIGSTHTSKDGEYRTIRGYGFEKKKAIYIIERENGKLDHKTAKKANEQYTPRKV